MVVPLQCSSPDVPFAEPMKVPAGSLFLVRSELASPPQSWDPKTGRQAPPIYCGFSKASETAQVEVFSCAEDGANPISRLHHSASFIGVFLVYERVGFVSSPSLDLNKRSK
jgi:hypothetical protein